MNKNIITLVVILIIGALGYFTYSYFTTPLPGEAVKDLGNQHVTDISGIEYNSNPPTSGTHFPVWAKPGVYDYEISDGFLIHSLEHGYIVISYNCENLSAYEFNFVTQAMAHESEEPHEEPYEQASGSGEPLTKMTVHPQGTMSWFTPDDPPVQETELPESFSSEACSSLRSRLSEFANSSKNIIVVPRTGLDTTLALTAWGRIDKFDDFDEARIKKFIRTFHNAGPEQTNE